MDTYYRPTRAEIDLDALQHNLQAYRDIMPKDCLMLASVKANAYGHGAVEVAREAERFGVDYLGVAFLDEAIQIRKAGIRTPILVLGYVPAEGLELAREYNVTISLFREDILEAASLLPSDNDGRRLKAHIKIDSGMGRLGLLGFEQAIDFIHKALEVPQLEVEGMFTHYAKADETDKDYTRLQYSRFNQIVQYVKEQKLPISIIHAANSAAGIDTPEWAGDMLRLGIGMYGLYPSREVKRLKIQLKPVMSLKTAVSMTKTVPEGWGISYGTRYFAAGKERIGTLPIGYADGYSRMLTGKAHALIRGVKSPIRGTICMDQCMLALDEAEQATSGGVIQPDEEVVLMGEQGSARITAEDIADQLGTINYEITCMLASRVPRVYKRAGEVVSVNNPLL